MKALNHIEGIQLKKLNPRRVFANTVFLLQITMKAITIAFVFVLFSFNILAQTCMEKNIRVCINCSCHMFSTSNPTSTIVVVPSESYVKRVLAHEWMPCWGDKPGGMEALKAGAVAIRTYTFERIAKLAGKITTNNIHDMAKYDMCDNGCCQRYINSQSTNTDNAVDNTTDYFIYKGDAFDPSLYGKENNNSGCPNGNGYSGTGAANSPCVQDLVCTGETQSGNGEGMCQNGSARWATGYSMPMSTCIWAQSPHGYGTKTWDKIIEHYYPGSIAKKCGSNPPAISFKFPWPDGTQYYVSRSGPLSPYPNTSDCNYRAGNDFGNHTYRAIDFDVPNGVHPKVLASAEGTVVYAALNGSSTTGYGNLVKIKHNDGTFTYYAHNFSFAPGIMNGVSVQQGCHIANAGNTGDSQGDHIHWEWRDVGEAKNSMWGTFADCGNCHPVAGYCYTSTNTSNHCQNATPKVPKNDNCDADAAHINYTFPCNFTEGSVEGATPSGLPVTPGCDCTPTPVLNDVWYEFKPATNGYSTITVDPDPGFDAVVTVYESIQDATDPTNACMQPPRCVNGGGIDATEIISISSSNRNYYMIRVYGYGTSTKFGICVTATQGSSSIPDKLTISPSAPAPFCEGGYVNLQASIPIGIPTSYLWSNGATTQSINATSSGSYTVKGNNGSACLRTSDVTSVTVNSNVDAGTVSGTSTLCLNQTATYTAINATAGGSWSIVPGTGAATVDANGLLTPSAAGNCDVKYTVNSGCGSPVSATKQITIYPLPLAAAGLPQSICNSNSTTIGATAVLGSTYSWSPATGLSSTTVSNPTANPATTTTYYVTETITATTCANTNSVVVTVNPKPTMTSSSTATICSGGTVSIPLTSDVASTYTWIATDNVNTTGESITIQTTSTLSNTITNSTALAQNVTYTVTPTSSVGSCTGASQTVTVTVKPKPTVTVPSNITKCHNGSISATTFTSNPTGATYAWTNSNTAIGLGLAAGTGDVPAFTATNTTAAAISGAISVTPTLNNCTGTASSYTITVNPLPTSVSATSNRNPTCIGYLLRLSGVATGATSWNWTGPNLFTSTLQDPEIANISTLNAGVYTLIATSSAGCSQTAYTDWIIVNPIPSASISTTTDPTCGNCNGSRTITGSAGTGPYSYQWFVNLIKSSGNTSNIPDLCQEDNILYVVNDANNCQSDQQNATISACISPPPPTTCTYTLNCYDTRCDGWVNSCGSGENAYITFKENGLPKGNYGVVDECVQQCVSSSTSNFSTTITVGVNSSLSMEYTTNGNYDAEHSYSLISQSGSTVISGATPDPIAPGGTTQLWSYGGGSCAGVAAKTGSTFVSQVPQEEVSGITIYPNPTHGSFVVDMIFDKEQAEVMVSVTNILGEVILKHKLNDIKKELYQIDLSKYGAGVYFIKIAPTDEELAVRKKVVVTK